ncbi:hypothetical protein J1614_000799 [Plenodomus biglobosus]|nr:hypothetical protein J1614_000799 [Plenodomus biglobosus]
MDVAYHRYKKLFTETLHSRIRDGKGDVALRWAFSIFTCLARICKEEFHRSGQKEFLQESFELIKRAHALDRRWSRDFDHLLVMSEMYYEDFRRTGSRRPLDHAIEFGVRASEISLDSRAK